MSDDGKKLSKALDDPLSNSHDPNKKEWVKFEEEDDGTNSVAANEKVFLVLVWMFCIQKCYPIKWIMRQVILVHLIKYVSILANGVRPEKLE